MALTINTNPVGIFTVSQAQRSNDQLNASLQRLASGSRINQAADDASGMVIADSLSSQALGMGQAIRNASDAISMGQVADGALGESAALIQTIRVKALQAAQGSQSLESRQAIQADIDKALASLDQIANNTTYNGQPLLTGSFTNRSFQVGANAGETVTTSIDSAASSQLGGDAGSLADINVLTPEGAQDAIDIADQALQQVDSMRAEIGATQNQLASTVNNLTTSSVNIQAAASSITDVDYADEAMVFARLKALNAAKIFAATQAGKINQGNVIDLLQG